MDTETRLHGRRSYRRKCDLHQTGGFVQRNDPMQASSFRSDPDASHVRLPDHPPPRELASCEQCVSVTNTSWVRVVQILLIAIVAIIEPATAASINFDNCMSPILISGNRIQFRPIYVNATFNSSAASHGLNITVYGNVTGQTLSPSLPAPSDLSYWQNPNETEGKIPELSNDNGSATLTTLKTTFNVLDYTLKHSRSGFCESLVQGKCPLAPSFTSG